jgi:hypothetical protein
MTKLEETLIEVWQQALVENAKFVVLGNDSFCSSSDSQARSSASGLHFRRERDSGTGAEPRNQIPVGANGTRWQLAGELEIERPYPPSLSPCLTRGLPPLGKTHIDSPA